MNLTFIAWIGIFCLLYPVIFAQDIGECDSFIPICGDTHPISLTFILDLSGCNCVSQFENIQSWKRLNHEFRKNGKVQFCAFTLSRRNDTLGDIYGFDFNFIDAKCALSARSVTILRDHGQTIFLKNGPLRISEYLLIKRMINERCTDETQREKSSSKESPVM